MEFGCLHLASQIWVKQDQPAKYDAKLSQSHNKQLWSPAEDYLTSMPGQLGLEEATT